MPPEYLDAIVTGDARLLAERIPDESIHLILCDPVYWQIDDYAWLAKLGERVLVPGGNLIAQTSNPYLFEVMTAVRRSSLMPLPVIAEVRPCQAMGQYSQHVLQGYKPYVWASKGPRRGGYLFDCMTGGGNDKANHKWGDAPLFFWQIVSRLTEQGETVLDPFTGGGTVPAVCKQLRRHYVGFEIDPDTAEKARQRVENTQEPLFVIEPEQLSLEAEGIPGE